MSEIVCRDLYVKIIDKKGESHIACHRVWDGPRFFESLAEQHKKQGGKVEPSTREAYLAERKR